MQEMLLDRKPINLASERLKQMEAIIFGVKASLRQGCVRLEVENKTTDM